MKMEERTNFTKKFHDLHMGPMWYKRTFVHTHTHTQR